MIPSAKMVEQPLPTEIGCGPRVAAEPSRPMYVVLVNVKGDTLRTELLNWDESKQLIYTDQFVRITTPDEIITGTGFESNAEFTKYKISKISGTFDLAK